MSYKYNPPSGNVSMTRRDIETEFRRWNAQADEKVITDYDLPYANAGTREAVVVFILRGARMSVRIDRWGDFATNLRCAYLNIRDMRLAEARGSFEAMRETLLGLPAPVRERDPYEVLGVRSDTALEDIEAMYRSKAKRLHPDAGGSDEAMRELNAAFERVKQERAVVA